MTIASSYLAFANHDNWTLALNYSIACVSKHLRLEMEVGGGLLASVSAVAPFYSLFRFFFFCRNLVTDNGNQSRTETTTGALSPFYREKTFIEIPNRCFCSLLGKLAHSLSVCNPGHSSPPQERSASANSRHRAAPRRLRSSRRCKWRSERYAVSLP